MNDTLQNSPLGKKIEYPQEYSKRLLFSIDRNNNRSTIDIAETLPFSGCDIWNAYELSWLNTKGKPIIAIGQFCFPCESSHIIESKSFKLYLNSFNQSHFENSEEVKKLLERDLSEVTRSSVQVRLFLPASFSELQIKHFPGICIDDIDLDIDCYSINNKFLKASDEVIDEKVYSNLLKSNCEVTNQPDWGSVFISYKGPQIEHEGLLRYLISFRNHNEFHEPCIERIYTDIMRLCQPEKLTVYGKYLRRGGLDICPFRSNYETINADMGRTPRQ